MNKVARRKPSGKCEVDCFGEENKGKAFRLRAVWANMICRCHSEGTSGYHKYGARGIYVCDEWRSSWRPFAEWSLANGYEPGMQIDRRDNNGPYSPGNCRWVSRILNARNKRNNHFVTAFGETKPIGAWAEDQRCQVSKETLCLRLTRLKWNAERAITEPSQERGSHFVEAFGEKKTLMEWAKDARCVVGYWTLKQRINRCKWPPEKAITEEVTVK